jgi:tRNA modification GTPase
MFSSGETISAIATPRGVGALGIVRLSGAGTLDILSKCFKTSDAIQSKVSHKTYYGTWSAPNGGELIDEAVVLYFAKGRGYTGEEAAEIICHGGPQVLESVLQSTLSAGAVLARPGEFSLRAVLNGRIDLVQAENVLQLIHANSPKAASRAIKQIKGALSERLNKLELGITFILANLEASIDFTTEDIQPVDMLQMLTLTERHIEEVSKLIESYNSSQNVNEGVRIALIGRPNAGKSSVLNALLGRKRSIVSSEPGTTRDLVEAKLIINGRLVLLVDTAGLRIADSESEKQGVELSLEETKVADHIFYIIDSGAGLKNEDASEILKLRPELTTVCFNKIDISTIDIENELNRFGLQKYSSIKCSALSENGCEKLVGFLAGEIVEKDLGADDFDVSTLRQKEALVSVFNSLKSARSAIAEKKSPEFVSLDLQEARKKVLEVLGKNIDEDIMNTVFQQFCIGK